MDNIKRFWPGWSLTREIGSGAHGTVYIAKNAESSSLAAVKIIALPSNDSILDDAHENGISDNAMRDYLRRFKDDLAWELTLYRTESSAGLAGIDAFEFEDNAAIPGWRGYIRMPLYTSIAERYGERPSPPEAMRILYSVGEALRSCEARSVVHGGVRPSNIMITDNGELVLCDFAIHRCLGAVGGGLLEDKEPIYDAPETLNGEFTPASDVYSMGMVGKVLLGDDAPDAVMRCLNKATSENPALRYMSAAEFMADLRRAEAESAEEELPVPTPPEEAPQEEKEPEQSETSEAESEKEPDEESEKAPIPVPEPIPVPDASPELENEASPSEESDAEVIPDSEEAPEITVLPEDEPFPEISIDAVPEDIGDGDFEEDEARGIIDRLKDRARLKKALKELSDDEEEAAPEEEEEEEEKEQEQEKVPENEAPDTEETQTEAEAEDVTEAEASPASEKKKSRKPIIIIAAAVIVAAVLAVLLLPKSAPPTSVIENLTSEEREAVESSGETDAVGDENAEKAEASFAEVESAAAPESEPEKEETDADVPPLTEDTDADAETPDNAENAKAPVSPELPDNTPEPEQETTPEQTPDAKPEQPSAESTDVTSRGETLVPDEAPENESAPKSGGYLYPSDTELITVSELSGMDRYGTYMVLNEIYARHGKIFSTPKIQAYFESQSWYTPDTTDSVTVERRFSKTEMANFNTIINYQYSAGYRK